MTPCWRRWSPRWRHPARAEQPKGSRLAGAGRYRGHDGIAVTRGTQRRAGPGGGALPGCRRAAAGSAPDDMAAMAAGDAHPCLGGAAGAAAPRRPRAPGAATGRAARRGAERGPGRPAGRAGRSLGGLRLPGLHGAAGARPGRSAGPGGGPRRRLCPDRRRRLGAGAAPRPHGPGARGAPASSRSAIATDAAAQPTPRQAADPFPARQCPRCPVPAGCRPGADAGGQHPRAGDVRLQP